MAVKLLSLRFSSFDLKPFKPVLRFTIERILLIVDHLIRYQIRLQVKIDMRPLKSGLYVPTVCFFDQVTEELDTSKIASHTLRLAEAGVSGIATQGSTGEAVHLNHTERAAVTQTTRAALDEAGYTHLPIIVGCSAQSVRETLTLCRQAHISGGDYALLLPPNYYSTYFQPAADSIIEFFLAVADQSPIPIIIYNYPSAVSGIDLSSEVIIQLSTHPKIIGVKLTCGNTGKLNRIVAATATHNKDITLDSDFRFLVFGGSADFTIQSLIGGAHGVLAGLANIAPKACARVIRLYNGGQMTEALRLQQIVARGDWVAIQSGVPGLKAGMQSWLGYGGNARSPLPKLNFEQFSKLHKDFLELMDLENEF